MDQLPQELIDRISRHLLPQDLKNTLLLSRAFRFPAEMYSGAFTRFSLDKDTAERFVIIFSGHRLSYLRDLQCEIRLPPPDNSERRDNADQLRKHDVSFTEQIMLLFKTVKSVEERAEDQNRKIRLAISPPLRPILHGRSLSYYDHLSWRIQSVMPSKVAMEPPTSGFKAWVARMAPLLQTISCLEVLLPRASEKGSVS